MEREVSTRRLREEARRRARTDRPLHTPDRSLIQGSHELLSREHQDQKRKKEKERVVNKYEREF